MKKNKFSQPNVITFNCVINACVKCNDIDKAWEIFEEMKKMKKYTPDLITYSTLIKGCCKSSDLKSANSLIMKMSS